MLKVASSLHPLTYNENISYKKKNNNNADISLCSSA